MLLTEQSREQLENVLLTVDGKGKERKREALAALLSDRADRERAHWRDVLRRWAEQVRAVRDQLPLDAIETRAAHTNYAAALDDAASQLDLPLTPGAIA